MSWTEEQLSAVLRGNPGLRVADDPFRRPKAAADTVECSPVERDYLIDLMMCPSFKGRLEPEEEVSLWCASGLRQLTRERRLRAVWCCVPGEQKQGGRLGAMHQARVVALGFVPGTSDFLFLWDTGAGGIELKVEEPQASLLAPGGKPGLRKGRRTYQRPRQKDFQRWCEEQGVKYAVCRRWGEMRAVLEDWGRVDA